MHKCPYCNQLIIRGNTAFAVTEHPYPYRTPVQSIDKVICGLCGEYHFEEVRHGSTINADNKYYHQIYKQGHYQLRDLSTPLTSIGD